MQATPEERLYRIVTEGHCIGCGLCQSIAGRKSIRVVKVENGSERPVVVGELDHETVDLIYKFCPGTSVQGLPQDEISSNTKIDEVWGPWLRMVRAWAGDSEIRHEGSTGGVLTALAAFLLESGRVDFVLHAKASVDEPTFGEQQVSFTKADVMEAAGSRYGPTAMLVNLEEVLELNQPFAVIGKPCDIGALRSFASHDTRLGKLARYWLTLVCGGYMPQTGMNAFLDRENIDPDAVTGLRYRGRGCPGPTRIETVDTAREVHYLDLWGEDESGWVLPWRCKICPDGIGEAADIAASDTWIGGSPDRVESETDLGTNGVVVRTLAGMELFEAAVAAGALETEYEITPEEMNAYQPHQVEKKLKVWARYQGLRDAGYMVPNAVRLRIKQLSEKLGGEGIESQRKATLERINIGKAREPIPIAVKDIIDENG